jgi:energy-coupling factor transport system ATP-binding protein
MIRQLADDGKTILIIEHRVEDVLSLNPDLVMLMEEGRVTYLGSADGVLQTADYRAVKLPAPVVISRASQSDEIKKQLIPPVVDPGAEALVEFKDTHFNYPGGPEVINGVNLTIRRGDIIALLGPNGAGKTTLIKHAIGLLKPTRGQVLLGGIDSQEMSVAEMAQTVGYVFQSPRHMLFAPSVREELGFGPKNLGHSSAQIEESTERALAVVGLSDEIDRAPLALSFGQQKRVTIASVLAMHSKILVMDEPTAGQDFANYMSFMDSVLGLRGGNGKAYSFAAIVFITHDLDLAVTHANRVVLMSAGQVVRDGPPQEVLADFDLLKRCRVIPTTLLKANLDHLNQTGAFMRAEALAQAIQA